VSNAPGVTWGSMKDATEKAVQIVKMNVAKARLLEPVSTIPSMLPMQHLIIGVAYPDDCGPVSAEQGFDVHIVEERA